MSHHEHTFFLVKPEGVNRALVGEIIKRFENRGFKIVALKQVWLTEDQAKSLYSAHAGKPFFDGLIKSSTVAPAVAGVVSGKDAVHTIRHIVGETDPIKAHAGTIRGDFALDIAKNVIHASDSVENSKRETAIFFKPEEQLHWVPANEHLVYP